MGKRKYPMVVVDWEDSCHNTGYYDPAKADKEIEYMPIKSRSMGFLCKSDRKRVVLAQCLFPTEDDLRQLETIPRGMIRKITRLKEVEAKHVAK